MSASSTLVSTCIFVRSWAMVKSVGADRLAATVCPISTAREMTTPSTGARIVVWSRSTFAWWSAAAFCFTWALAESSIASATLRLAIADWMAEASASSCARAESSCATAESFATWAESRSLLAMSCRAKSSVLRSRSRLVSTTATCAFTVCALPSAWAARAFATSARARSICARWLRTAALAEARSAFAWFTFASKISGSIRAITSPCRTTELKSADSCLIWPEIWLPTWPVITALRLPVAAMAAARDPRSTRANRYAGTLAPPWTDEYAQTPAPTRDSRNTRDRTRFVRSARGRGDRAPNPTAAPLVRLHAYSLPASALNSVDPRNFSMGDPLQLIEAPVPAAQRDQLLVGPALDDSALFEDEDQIGLGRRLEVVGNEQAGSPGHE